MIKLKNMEGKANGRYAVQAFVKSVTPVQMGERTCMRLLLADETGTGEYLLCDDRTELARSCFMGKVVDVNLCKKKEQISIVGIKLSANAQAEAFRKRCDGEVLQTEETAEEKTVETEARPMFSQIADQTGNRFCLPVLLTEIGPEKKSSNGNTYYSVTVTDGAETKVFNRWGDDAAVIREFIGKVVSVTLTLGKYVNIEKLELCETIPVTEFIRTVPKNPNEMYDAIVSVLASMQSPLAKVALIVYEENKEKLLRWAGAMRHHHAVYGGLLYHMYRMMQAAQALSAIYPVVNGEHLILGAVLHDIGKLQELKTQETGVTEFMPEGTLLGHITLGIEMLTAAADKLEEPVDAKELMRLKHMLAAHHGQFEYGSPVLPATPEAMLLHLLDQIDSKLYVFEETLSGLDENSTSSPLYALNGVRVYRP